jgi:hypothetical protein
MRVTTLTCLFVSKDGRLSIHQLEPPAPPKFQLQPMPSGMKHAAKVLGLLPFEPRVFKRTAEGSLPVYEEV